MRKSPAEQMGIIIGKIVVREDWRSSDPEGAPYSQGTLVIRDNHITLAGSNDDSPVFYLWHVEQPPELLAA